MIQTRTLERKEVTVNNISCKDNSYNQGLSPNPRYMVSIVLTHSTNILGFTSPKPLP